MKKTFLFAITALAALLAISCQKEEAGRILTATIEQYESDTKAYIDADNYACWDNGDLVCINGTQCTIRFQNGSQGTANTAIIEGSENFDENETLLAFYPASRVSDLFYFGGTVTLPHTQIYRENNGHQVIDNPMAAFCPAGSNKLRFCNLGAILRVTVNTTDKVRAIQVKGDEDQMLLGEARLALNNEGNPRLDRFTDGSNSVILLIPKDVTPSSNTFYIVVPAKSDFEYFTIAVLTTDGTTYTHHCKTSNIDQNLPRNHMGAISYTPSGDENTHYYPDWFRIRYTGSSPIDNPRFRLSIVSHTFNDGHGEILLDHMLASIGPEEFENNSSLTSIDLSLTAVTTIQSTAFENCSALESIALPDMLNTIDECAFERCSSLTDITIPNTLEFIRRSAFMYCTRLPQIDLSHTTVTTIEENAFLDCDSLTRVDLPNTLVSIESGAFGSCYSLSSINFPNTLNSIGDYAFSSSKLSQIDLSNTVVTTIGEYTFSSCLSLPRIDLPATLESISIAAFQYCHILKTVICRATTPPNLGTYALANTHADMKIYVPDANVDDYKGAPGWSDYAGKIYPLSELPR